MKSVDSYPVQIFVGLKERYTGPIHHVDEALDIVQDFVEIGWCVTVTETTFVYKGAREPGIIVGAINYPRFPSDPDGIRLRAWTLAERLMKAFNQNRVSIQFQGDTVMLEADTQSGGA